MLIRVYFLFLLEFVIGQKQIFRGGNRYSPTPYYDLNPKSGNGVGVLQDLSNARILSNEPFIISFEFPKLIGSGGSRKNRFGAKRTKSQRKKNRRTREFRHVAKPEEDILQRKKRLQLMHRPPRLESLGIPNLITDERKITTFTKNEDNLTPTEAIKIGRLLNVELQTEQTEQEPVQVQNRLNADESHEITESVHHKNWENIKKKWISLFAKNKDGNEVEGDGVVDEERVKALTRKMRANCQLLKILKAPQRNPYFYKLLPPNFPALIMHDEKQLECNQFYDIIDLAKDKNMIEDKINQLEQILTTENNSGTRKRREAPTKEDKSEEENTLQDEELQGKSEGEMRTDRSRRTKERQHIRRERSKEAPKEKTKRLHRNSKKNKSAKGEINQDKEGRGGVERSRGKDGNIEATAKKILEEADLKPEEDHTEKKREKQEIKSGQDNSLQDVFSPSEVNKVIRQKEMEANIFDKVLRAMKKFEENNPYDESFRPQKRESGNQTAAVVVKKNDSSEDEWELEDTIKKLAKIFKVLGMKAEAAKKRKEGSDESSSEESNENEKVRKNKIGKTPKCTCAECPFCQDCYQCFKECRKAAALSAKNNQTPVSSTHLVAGKGSNGEKDLTIGQERDSVTLQEEHSNNVKLERMYRSKLPPSRDLVRVYFDNPENKLLVWSKRGRRTMPWGSLANDLQLYRDRARQILKSAEEILHRIRDTEDKIHNEEYDGNGQESQSDGTRNIKNMDDIIKKVVNEDKTRNILKTPWEAELEKGVQEGNVLKSNQISKHFEEQTTYNIFKDGIRERTELPKESLTIENALVNPSHTDKDAEFMDSYEVSTDEAGEPKTDKQNDVGSINEKVEEKNKDEEMDSKSIEAAVLPIEKNIMTENVKVKMSGTEGNIKNLEESQENERETEEEEDVPAKVEAVNYDEVTVEGAWKTETNSNINADSQTKRKQVIEYMKSLIKPENLQNVNKESIEVKAVGDESENVKQTHSDESQSEEDRSDTKSENVEKASDTEKAVSDESEEDGYREDFDEKEKSQNTDSEEVEGEFHGETAEEEKSSNSETKIEKSENFYSRETEEVEKVRSSFSSETEESEKANSGEDRKKSYNKELEEVEEAYSGEKEEEKSYTSESEEVEKALSEGSEEKEKLYRGESDEKKEKGAQSQSTENESAKIESIKTIQSSESEEVERAYNKGSEEADEVSKERESVEKGSEQNNASQDEGRSAEDVEEESSKFIKAGIKKTLYVKKGWQQPTDVAKRVKEVMDELRKAVKTEKLRKRLQDNRKEESQEVKQVMKNKQQNQASEEIPSYEDAEEVERKETKVEEDLDQEVDDSKEVELSKMEVKEPETVETKPKDEEHDFEDHIKSIEESYIIKGVKQTKEEKEAILRALMVNLDKKKQGIEDVQDMGESDVWKNEDEEEKTAAKKPTKTVEGDGDSLKTVVQHLESGYMDENDFEAIKKLDESQTNRLVEEMQKNDEKGTSVNCETRLKLCQAVCNCNNNGTDSDLNKYEIIKGFLGWLKDVKMEKMIPISV